MKTSNSTRLMRKLSLSIGERVIVLECMSGTVASVGKSVSGHRTVTVIMGYYANETRQDILHMARDHWKRNEIYFNKKHTTVTVPVDYVEKYGKYVFVPKP